MKVYFSTVVRGAPVRSAGEVIRLDWATKQVEARLPIYPENPDIVDPNPRGNSRGGRGIVLLPGGKVIVASYHSIYICSADLSRREQISHPWFAGLHEMFLTNRMTIWLASTAVDAALEFDLRTRQVVNAFWPREMPGIQRVLGVEPLAIDKTQDNRARFLEERFTKHPHHLHLNAVVEHRGEVFALFHAFGAIANLTRDEVVLRSPVLRGAHNLWFLDEYVVALNNTYRRSVQIYDLVQQRLIREISLLQFAPVRRLVSFWQEAGYRMRGIARKLGLKRISNPLPYFVRGMAVRGQRAWIGLSPASVLELDLEKGELLDWYNYSLRLAVTVHGLAVEGR